jgi:hypothetical protein
MQWKEFKNELPKTPSTIIVFGRTSIDCLFILTSMTWEGKHLSDSITHWSYMPDEKEQ